jgi:hypothetical protein
VQYPAIVGITEQRNPFVYAGFANPSNAQQPLTAHRHEQVSGSSPLVGSLFYLQN